MDQCSLRLNIYCIVFRAFFLLNWYFSSFFWGKYITYIFLSSSTSFFCMQFWDIFIDWLRCCGYGGKWCLGVRIEFKLSYCVRICTWMGEPKKLLTTNKKISLKSKEKCENPLKFVKRIIRVFHLSPLPLSRHFPEWFCLYKNNKTVRAFGYVPGRANQRSF